MHSARAQETPLKICQTTALSGPLGDLGTALQQGAKAALAVINARGGIHGRPIELHSLDDAYEVPRALSNLEQLLADPDCFALFNCFGTPMVEAMLPKLNNGNMPFFAPYTGGQVSRVAGARHIFNIRASYAEEADKLVQHLATIGIKRIGIAYQNNTFGREVFTGAQQAMVRARLPDAVSATVESDASDAKTAAHKLADSGPEAVLVGLAGKPALEFVKHFRAARRGVSLYAVSVLGTSANIKALGQDATGMAISQVVPVPTNAATAVARDFLKAWRALDANAEPSHIALEGYINARVFAEALQRAGKNPTRAAFIDATWSLKKLDLGGFEINATTPERNASRFVELTVVGRDGRLIR
jgi:ABC-type branched-subunit amino acid transport system substrate-binding protein